MTKVEALEREVQKLTPEELTVFRDWFVEYDWHVWDRQIERDVAEGRLDRFAAEALAEFERGETKEIRVIKRRSVSGAISKNSPLNSSSLLVTTMNCSAPTRSIRRFTLSA